MIQQNRRDRREGATYFSWLLKQCLHEVGLNAYFICVQEGKTYSSSITLAPAHNQRSDTIHSTSALKAHMSLYIQQLQLKSRAYTNSTNAYTIHSHLILWIKPSFQLDF